MAWWVPLMAMGGQMMQKNQQAEQAKNSRLRYYGGADRDTSGMNMAQGSSLLSSVFGIDMKKPTKPKTDLGLFDTQTTGSRLELSDVEGYEEGLWNGGW